MLLIQEAAVKAWLLGDTAITARVGTRIYIKYVPTGVAYPYIVISLNAQLNPNREAAQSKNSLINVQAVSDGGSASEAALIANAVEARLDNAVLALPAPYTMRRCEFESAYDNTDIEDGKRYFMAGGLYRTEVDKN